jgi:hypothetical protein
MLKCTEDNKDISVIMCADNIRPDCAQIKIKQLIVNTIFFITINIVLFDGKFCKLTYLLTPWSIVLLEKLTGLQLVQKFPAFYGTRRFITAFTSSRHLSLS